MSRPRPGRSAGLGRAPCESLRGNRVQRLLQRTLTALWIGIIPAILAVLALKFLVPPLGTGLVGAVASLGHRAPLVVGIALFFLFSGQARYWRFRIPGGRYASALPAHLVPGERDGERLAAWAANAALYELASSPALRRTVEPAALEAMDARRLELRAALEIGDARGARAAADAVKSNALAVFAARRRREVLATLGATGLAAVLAYGVRTLVVEPYEVLSASMLPTLEPGDRIAGDKLPFATARDRLPRRGDVLVFQSSAVLLPAGLQAPEVLVKRVIGLPGDRVAMKGGQPVINGWPVPYCDAGEYVFLQSQARGATVHGRLRVEFIDDRAYLTVDALSLPFRDTYEVKPGEVFVLGDNRGNSLDSRAWDRGHGSGVPLAAVDARAQWFLVGTRRSGDADFGRFGRALDTLEAGVRLEGLNTQALDAAIARCLANQPAETRPPPPGEPAGPRASRESE